MQWPFWWDWELELSPHVLKRMLDRRFNESELRTMLEGACMTRSYLEVTYRAGKPFAAYFHLPRRPGDGSVRTEKSEPGLPVDYTSDGRAIGGGDHPAVYGDA